jgi:hypothetical protein
MVLLMDSSVKLYVGLGILLIILGCITAFVPYSQPTSGSVKDNLVFLLVWIPLDIIYFFPMGQAWLEPVLRSKFRNPLPGCAFA